MKQLLRRIDRDLYHEDDGEGAARLRWLGTAGFTLELPSRTLVIDPYVSRPGVLAHRGPLIPDDALVASLIPEADEVLIGHAHYDHILDAPSVCRRTGARLVGSPSACNVGRAAGLPESQLVSTTGDEDIACGEAVVARGLPSAHGRAYFNRVPLAGKIEAPPPWPPRFWDLRHGQVLNWWVRGHGLSVVHIDSAEFRPDALRDVPCDVLCLCAIGRRYRPRYVSEALELLRPRYVVPCHWDYFFLPFHAEQRQLPGVDLEGFLTEIRQAGGQPVLLPVGGQLSLSVAP